MLASNGTWTCSAGQRRLLDLGADPPEAEAMLKSCAIIEAVPWAPHLGLKFVFSSAPNTLLTRSLASWPSLGRLQRGVVCQ